MKNIRTKEEGFIKLIILFIIFCVIVWYFKLDVRGYIDSHPQIKNSLLSMISFLKGFWKNYLEGAGAYIWNDIIIDIVWKTIIPIFSGK